MDKVLKSPYIPQADNGVIDKDTISQDMIVIIPVWNNKSVGDVVNVFWGSFKETYVVQSVADSVMLSFPRDTISAGNYIVYYSITDAAGNIGESPQVSIRVTETGSGSLITLPAPRLPQATDGVIDLSVISNDIAVKCYPENVGTSGDTLRVHFGNILTDVTLTFPVSMTPTVYVPRVDITRGNYVVYYEILHAGTQIGISPSVEVDVVLDIFLSAPVFPAAVNGVVNLEEDGLFVEMDIPRYDSAERGDEIYSYIGITKGPVTVVEYPEQASFPVKFKKESLEAGTFKARYEVRKMDDYEIQSPVTNITFSDSVTPPVSEDKVWEQFKAGKAFYIKQKDYDQYIYPAYIAEEGFVYYNPNYKQPWVAKIIDEQKKTFKLLPFDYHGYFVHIGSQYDGYYMLRITTNISASSCLFELSPPYGGYENRAIRQNTSIVKLSPIHSMVECSPGEESHNLFNFIFID